MGKERHRKYSKVQALSIRNHEDVQRLSPSRLFLADTPNPNTEVMDENAYEMESKDGLTKEETLSNTNLMANPSVLKAGINAVYKMLSEEEPIAPKATRSRVNSSRKKTQDTRKKSNNGKSDMVALFNKETLTGDKHFKELFQRVKLPNCNYTAEVDKDEFMECLFNDYEAKQELFKKHSRKVSSLTKKAACKCFDKFKSEILQIYEGTKSCRRMELYLTQDENDLGKLNSLNVSLPFTNDIYMVISEELFAFLFRKNKYRKYKYMECMRLVFIPETLVRIYSLVNKIPVEQAEKEMISGPHYEGPVHMNQEKSGASPERPQRT